MRSRCLWFTLSCLLALATPALAQQTGTLSGAVFDTGGRVVPGATITISGDVLPAPRTTVSSDNGLYTFLQLLPGSYTVTVEKTGVGKIARPAVVALGLDTQLDVILGQQVSETVAVSATAPRIDMKSTEVTFNYRRDFIQDLPLERTYLGLMQLIPGIAENGAFAPNGGGSRQDNVYLLDGVNITNPLFGYLATEVNELDIVEINAKRGAVNAASGRAQGFITNAVTRSGTNRFSGGYRFEAIPSEWVKVSRNNIRSITDRWVNAFNLGGPIVKDRLFFYGSSRIFRSKATRAANVFGPLPDRKEQTNEFFGKLTGSLGADMALNVGYRHRPTEIEYAGIGANDSPAVGTNSEGTNRVINVNYDWFARSRTTITAKYVRMDEQSEAVAVTDLGFQPPFDPKNLAEMGRVVVGGVAVGGASLRLNRQNYYRDEVKADLTHFFDLGRMQHEVTTGFGWNQGVEDLTRQSNGWGDISNVTVSGQKRIRGNYYPEQPTQLSKGRSYSLFFQDDITLHARLTVNVGVLMNRDELIQDIPNLVAPPTIAFESGTFLTFGFGDQVQPRLGFSYQLRNAAGDKVYGNYGRYSGLDQTSGARSMASGRLYTEDSDFDPVTGALIARATAANTANKTIIRPIKRAVHRRGDLRLRDAARRRLDHRLVLHVSRHRQLHRRHPDGAAVLDLRLPERPGRGPEVQDVHDRAQPQHARQLGDERELRVEPALRQLRSGLLGRPRRRGRLQHVVAAERRPGLVHGGPEPPGRAEPGSPARLQGAGDLEPEMGREPERRHVRALAERHAVGGARPSARQRRDVSQLPRAGRHEPQPDLDEHGPAAEVRRRPRRPAHRPARGTHPEPVQHGDDGAGRSAQVSERAQSDDPDAVGSGVSVVLDRLVDGRAADDAAERGLRTADGLRDADGGSCCRCCSTSRVLRILSRNSRARA